MLGHVNIIKCVWFTSDNKLAYCSMEVSRDSQIICTKILNTCECDPLKCPLLFVTKTMK